MAGKITYPQWVLGEDRPPFKSRRDIGSQQVCISRLKRGAETGVWDRAERTFWYTAEKMEREKKLGKYNTAVDN